MLQEVERDPSTRIQGDNLTVNKAGGWELLAGTGDVRELRRKKIFAPGS
jgi:hypothetical protein